MTIQELIDALPNDNRAVIFDFGGCTPTGVASYRGYYRDLAIGFSDSVTAWALCPDLRAMLSDAIGASFEGYKGGEFTMAAGTKVWVANYGISSDTDIVGVRLLGTYLAVIETRYNTGDDE